MKNKIFLIGIIAGFSAALGLAGIFSMFSSQSNEQMNGNPGMMGAGFTVMVE